MESKRWYALYVKSRTEKKVVEELRRQGFDVYLPVRKELRQWSDRKKWVELPVVSGYVFVLIAEITQSKRLEILRLKNVISFVRNGTKDADISEREINDMRCVLEQTELTVSVNQDDLTAGQLVKIDYGSMQGVQAELLEVFGERKVVLRVVPFSCNIFIDVPLEHVTLL